MVADLLDDNGVGASPMYQAQRSHQKNVGGMGTIRIITLLVCLNLRKLSSIGSVSEPDITSGNGDFEMGNGPVSKVKSDGRGRDVDVL